LLQVSLGGVYWESKQIDVAQESLDR
jgi:hypothetical protein